MKPNQPTLDPNVLRPRPVVVFLFGVAAPLLCLVMDPIVFKSPGWFGSSGNGIAGVFRAPAWMTFGMAILVLCVWSVRSPDPDPAWRGFVAGTLQAGSVLANCIGVVMLPLTFIGLFFGIGILGLTPFVVGWVYSREARRALFGTPRCYQRKVGILVGFGLLVTTALCGFALRSQAERDIRSVIIYPDPDDPVVDRLKWIHWAGDVDRMVENWGRTAGGDGEWHPYSYRAERLRRVYLRITGRDIARDANTLGVGDGLH